jgi:AAA15 family ATPase/GTPase
MIPNNRLKTLLHHKYSFNEFELLKMASIYGANGSGKSNLIKAIKWLKTIVVDEKIPSQVKNGSFKFIEKKESGNLKQVFGIEFLQDDIPFYYAIEILENIILTEELYISGLGSSTDELIYERKTNKEGITVINFLPSFERDEKSQVLKQVLIEDFVKPNESILKLLSNRDNEYLQNTKKAFKWFEETLEIITPDSHPAALAHRIDTDSQFKSYAEDIMCSFHVGISGINSNKKNLKEFLGKDNEDKLDELIKSTEESPRKMIGLRSKRGDELIIVKEENEFYIKQLQLEHKGKNDIKAEFDLEEESDGTIRLLDFIPAFHSLVSKHRVYLVDEIERSIHPLLIKELIKKFSLDEASQGQLIFTTHESNLLDQELFRQDEIWFAEKDKGGVTDLYSLSDFKEHKTIDIRKGYLNGRYGSIPFLANLQDLNWHKYDINE